MIYLTSIDMNFAETTTLVDDIRYPQHAHIIPETFLRAKSGMSYPPHRLLESVVTPETREYVHNNNTPGKTAFIFAAGNQGWMSNPGRYDKNPDAELHYKVKVPFIVLTNIYAGRIASMFGPMDHVSTDASACASSLKVLMEVHNLMTNYGFSRVIVLTGEDAVNNLSLEFFGEAGASIQADSEQVPSAFDGVNQGFYLGQGAALAIFETHPAKPPLAKMLGAYSAAEDNTNPLGQREDGAGYSRAIEGALWVAKTPPNSVHMVKTHGTGTPVNNAAEKTALNRSLPEFVATSYKPRIGHTMGASGLLETGLMLNDISTGVVPAILNRTGSDPVFVSKDTEPRGDKFVSLAAGMGNIYSAALFSVEV